MDFKYEKNKGMKGILIMLNNYFHDMATGLLITSACLVFYFTQDLEKWKEKSVVEYFVHVYGRFFYIIIISLVFIVLGGAIRAYYYMEFEWANAVGNSQIPALIAKHIVIFAAVFLGGWGWFCLHKKVKQLRVPLKVRGTLKGKG